MKREGSTRARETVTFYMVSEFINLKSKKRKIDV